MLLFFCVYLGLASAYVLFARACVRHWRRDTTIDSADQPPISVLKPVYGLDVDLYANLRSFCEQTYPCYQVVFGVADAADPAIPVIRQLMAELPARDLALAVGGVIIGTNRKISNVANCLRLAKHELLIIADSDMRVTPQYLSRVAQPFARPEVGAATCLYRGVPGVGLASRLGAMFINECFLPSVLVALRFQKLKFCFGATMAVRRRVLDEIGGIARLADELADDYMLGNLVAARGYHVALIDEVVDNVVHEESLLELVHHELRWARTVRLSQPGGFFFSFITYVTPAALGVAAFASNWKLAIAAVALACALRMMMHRAVREVLNIQQRPNYLLVIARDLLCFGIWLVSFVSRNVEWRGHTFTVDRRGQMELKEITFR
jgi:ceramide glucosyltransferase